MKNELLRVIYDVLQTDRKRKERRCTDAGLGGESNLGPPEG